APTWSPTRTKAIAKPAGATPSRRRWSWLSSSEGAAMDAHVYALKSWTIKKAGDRFYIASSGQAGQHRWRGPYLNLKRATTAIARKLEWEFACRHRRVGRP